MNNLKKDRKLNHQFFWIILFLAGGLIFGASCKRKEKILIDGSSTVYPITEAVAEEYRKIEPNVHVTVGVSGTGGGFKKFCNGETDISDASRPIKKAEAEKCAKNGIQYLEMAIAFDGLAVLVNKKNKFVDNLTMEELKLIFQYQNHAMSWQKVRANFPDGKIKIFAPGQDSGTFDYFAEVILGKDAKMRTDSTFSEDDNVLVTGIAGEKFAIGFFGLAYYEANKDRLKLVHLVNPKTQKPVEPNQETVKSGEYFPLSRPIFIYVNKKAKARAMVAKFVNFYLDKAPDMSKAVGYIPMPTETYTNDKRKFQSF